jgi:hypothetical protein
MGLKSEETVLEQKKKNLESAVLDGELAALEALKAIVADKTVDAGVRLSASHILLQARSDLKRPDTTTES